jgi:hypothetical protein
VNLTVCVMLPARGSSDFSSPANPKYSVLDPVAVYLQRDTTQPIGAECTGYIHVTGVPTPPAWASLTNEEVQQRLNTKLCAPAPSGGRRAWGGLSEGIPVSMRSELLTERQISVTWAQFKKVLRNKVNSQPISDAELA